MSTRVFLTGITGYLGGVLAEHLSRLPEVTAITGIGPRPPRRPLPPKARFVPMDIRSPGVTGAMVGHDVVIHTAAVVLWRASMTAAERDDINLNGTRNVAQAALANRVPRFLHASSMAVYDPHLVRGRSGVTEEFQLGRDDSYYYYWSTKAAVERTVVEVLAKSGMLLTLLRPIYIIGPRCRVTVKGLRENAVNLLGHNPRRQFVHEDDVAAAFIQALRAEMPGPYNVVPDDFIRMSEVWRIVGARWVPTAPLWLARWITWIRWKHLGSPIHPSWVEDMLVDFTGSNARLKAAGWAPRHSSAEALRSALQDPSAIAPQCDETGRTGQQRRFRSRG
jgi:nucleoside-diphosphate-sugar epimerase